MKLTITIDMDNAAFEVQSGSECARILRKIAARIDGEDSVPGDITPCIDINGNKVGMAKVTR